MENRSLKRTPLFEEHRKMGARMMNFSGWSLPLEFEGLKKEHLNVRKNVGIFDISHMGEIRIQGQKALKTIDSLTTNNVTKLKSGQAQYSLILNNGGGVLDDVVVYCIEEREDYFLCVNARNTKKIFNWILRNNQGALVRNEDQKWSQIAVQGPKSKELLLRIFSSKIKEVRKFCFFFESFESVSCLVARTGYTGEEGFEIYTPYSKICILLWKALLEEGKDFEVAPIGLGARNTLRVEMRYSLYGAEITEEISPYEAGLGFWIKASEKDFIGKKAILRHKERGLRKKLVGFEMLERGIPRDQCLLFSLHSRQQIGVVTSGIFSPSLNKGIGLCYLISEKSQLGEVFEVEIRNRKFKAQVVKTPFLRKG